MLTKEKIVHLLHGNPDAEAWADAAMEILPKYEITTANRIAGFFAQCDAEAALAKKASAFTKNAVANALEVDVVILKWDKYGGRVLGEVYLDHQSLAESLISAGLARPYKGEAKSSWCE